MKTTLIIFLCALLGLAAADVAKRSSLLPKVRVTAKVVDETGKTLSGALVSFVFGEAYDAKAIVKVEGVTMGDGLFTGEGYSDGSYGAGITKDGFYLSGLGATPVSGIVDGRWQPWDATYTTTLRPIVRPAAFYAKTGWVDLPAIGESCGYDLEKGDWLAPLGTGHTADLIFHLERSYIDRQNFEVIVTLTFSQPQDGILEAVMPDIGKNSVFKWAREAPEEGYGPKLVSRFAHPVGGSYEQTALPQQNYFFRVRTLEQNGRIISAHYGKIRGGLQLAPFNTKTCKIKLTYYLNPTSLDRNMEWDPKRNLVPGLTWEENPREP